MVAQIAGAPTERPLSSFATVPLGSRAEVR